MVFLISLLSVVQVIVESLPISSSGHDALVQCLITWAGGSYPVVPEELYHVWHIPTLIIVGVFFRQRWLFVIRHLWRCRKLIMRVLMFGFCAELPTLFFSVLWQYTAFTFPLWIGFLVTGLLLLSTRIIRPCRQLTCVDAFLIGCAQGVALMPGISRLASTYAVARSLGIASRTSWAFSWTIAFPLMAGMCVRDLGAITLFTGTSIAVLAFAGIGAYWVFAWSAHSACRGQWWLLGVYMLVPALLALVFC